MGLVFNARPGSVNMRMGPSVTGKKADASEQQCTVTFTQMLVQAIKNRPSTFRQAERGIDRDESGPYFFYAVDDFVITKHDAGFSHQIT